MKFPGKFKTHWLGPYIIKHMSDGGEVQLAKLNGQLVPGRVNSRRLKVYIVSLEFHTEKRREESLSATHS